ncbi:hypothetical protein NHX12_011447 [Muraenolepis orangiensis]|uniref:Teneurin N-terminal domain-containing protein n=1 Tax=Muraenolepis orangiensis TaxID=630683 RepID=A0A9Q0DJP2_9TELE|nr:hypothetical protein NHX12_011447 [Muraenolepis orangiensis]
MDLNDRRNRSLNRGRCPTTKDTHYNTPSLDTDGCRVPTQTSYSSSDTLKAFDHEQRLHCGGCVTDLVHREVDEYSRQGGAGSDADSDPEGPLSPERAIQLWSAQGGGRSGAKSRRGSGVSSHENSVLTLTDSENDNKSDDESGAARRRPCQPTCPHKARLDQSHRRPGPQDEVPRGQGCPFRGC